MVVPTNSFDMMDEVEAASKVVLVGIGEHFRLVITQQCTQMEIVIHVHLHLNSSILISYLCLLFRLDSDPNDSRLFIIDREQDGEAAQFARF